MRKAVYAGSFDPVTNGHMFVIEQAANLFDEVVVSIGVNPDKVGRTMFSLEERCKMIWGAVEHLDNVVVSTFQSYLIYYCQEIGATHYVRGVRDATDFDSERRMIRINREWVPGIEPVIIIPDASVQDISSSFVKGLIGYDGWQEKIEMYVPPLVVRNILLKVGN